MSSPLYRLPARPSLDQLRKQAKERLDEMRLAARGTGSDATAVDAGAADVTNATGAANPRLSDAQLAVARDYGFASWPRLVHHVATVLSEARLSEFEALARDMLAAYHGDPDALDRSIAGAGVSYDRTQWHVRIRSRVDDARRLHAGVNAADDRPTLEPPTLAEIERIIANEHGHPSWEALIEALAQPRDSRPAAPVVASTTPPFYQIDRDALRIDVRAPINDGDWDTICDVMRDQGLVAISSPALTDAGLRRLARCSFITSIEMDGAQGFTDDGVRALAAMPELERLDLSGWHSPLGDRGLAVVAELPALVELKLCWPQRISDAGLAGLGRCRRLRSVNLMGTRTGDGTMDALRGLPDLDHLVMGRNTTDIGLRALHALPQLRDAHGQDAALDVMTFLPPRHSVMLDGPITDEGLASLEGLDGIIGLGIFGHAKAITVRGIRTLAAMRHVEMFAPPGDLCDDAAMTAIAAFPALRLLQAQGTVASDAGFAALGRSRTLEYLWARDGNGLSDGGFTSLLGIASLRGLAAPLSNVSETAMSGLADATLEQLVPMEVTNDAFRFVGQCSTLRDLWCMYCRDTGDGATRHIGGLALRSYYAGKTRITDASLDILARMSTLERIELWQTAGVTDAGIDALAALPRLRELVVSGVPGVTSRSIESLPSHVRARHSA